ncbi:hypothetical protein EDB59_1095 [Vibrio crassostreae]|nr:hypothetical protein EDB59_1095 [Vibrio crassostreae]
MNVKWTLVKILGNSNIVKSNYVWIFVLPFIAKNIDNINKTLNLDLAITFSLSRLFYASLCFAIATLIYQLRCPLMIKENANFRTFTEDGKNVQHIVEYHEQCTKQLLSNLNRDSMKEFCSEFDKDVSLENKDLISHVKGASYIDKELKDSFFWKMFNYLNTEFKFAAIFCLVFYTLGIIFLFLTALGNVLFAMHYFLPNYYIFEWLYSLIS